MEWDARLWEKSVEDFENFMRALASPVGRTERRVAMTQYVEGLLLPGKRKSIVPMAERLGTDSQRLQQFVTDSPWQERDVWKVVRKEVIPSLEPIEAWVVDETGWVKQGQQSVGVARQYCGAVGKRDNCQVSVEVAVSNGSIAAPVAGRLYLPEVWTRDPERCQSAGVPPQVEFQAKWEIARDLIEQTLRDGVAPAPVLGDAVYGDSSEFRASLRKLELEFFLQITPGSHKGWTRRIKTVLKHTRRHPAPGTPPPQTLRDIVFGLSARRWRKCRWTTADGTTRETRLAWCKVYLAHNLRKAGGNLEELWLVADWPADQPKPYHCYLAHLHRPPTRARCLTLSRSRWHIEHYYRRSKGDLGLDHFEGRSWRGFHHHLALSAVAYLFVLCVYLRGKKNFWAHVGTDAPLDPPLLAEIDRLLLLLRERIRERP